MLLDELVSHVIENLESWYSTRPVTRVVSTGRCNTIYQLIRQHFPRATDPFGIARSKPSQGGVPTDRTLASDFSVCFQGFVDRVECCIDLLKPSVNRELRSLIVHFAWIDEAENLSVADLVNLISEGSDALLSRFKKAGLQKQVADCLAVLHAPQLRALEELNLPERMELLLNVTRNGENYREVGKLSTGQQCMAILHLLLLDNPDPLVIDQPEDNLDNAFIADHIVNELRTSKTKRQFVFATHNANIPVFGDAEWIGVLNEEEGRSKLRVSGSIDAPDVKEFAANILEGGQRGLQPSPREVWAVTCAFLSACKRA